MLLLVRSRGKCTFDMTDLRITQSKQPCPLVQGPNKVWWQVSSAVAWVVFPQFQSTCLKPYGHHQGLISDNGGPHCSLGKAGKTETQVEFAGVDHWSFSMFALSTSGPRSWLNKLRLDLLNFPSIGFNGCPKPLWWWSAHSDLLANAKRALQGTYHVRRTRRWDVGLSTPFLQQEPALSLP